MRVIIHPTPALASHQVATLILNRITTFSPTPTRPFVLGLPTGSTPLAIYAHLIAFHRAGRLSFRNIITFNMDEYVGLPATHPNSYARFMHENLFNHVDMDPANIHLLNGVADDLERECAEYEAKIAAVGGVELFLAGLGTDGHLAFNEPGSSLGSRTRVKTLARRTRGDNARFFAPGEEVPERALTVGVATVMAAREVAIVAFGAAKGEAVRGVVEGPVRAWVPASALQEHERVLVVVDAEAAEGLGGEAREYFRDVEEGAERGGAKL